MQIPNIAASYVSSAAAQQHAAASTAASTASSTNDFMLMLLAQLTNQNPLEPLKDSEMLSQFAQLNSVQQLQGIQTLMGQAASANQTGYAASLIGKTITANLDNGDPLKGVVTGITIEAGKVYVHVGDQKAPVSSIVEIKEK